MLQEIFDNYSRRRYDKPPIREVLCEMHLQNGEAWHLTNFGILKQAYHEDYPSSFELPGFTLEIGQDQPKSGKGRVLASQQIQQRVQYKDTTGAFLVQAFPNLLTVNQIPSKDYPYTDWECFLARVTKAEKAASDAIPSLQGIRVFVIRFIDEFQHCHQSDTILGDLLNPKSTLIPIEVLDSRLQKGGQFFLEIPAIPIASALRIHLDWTDKGTFISFVLDSSVSLFLDPPRWLPDIQPDIAAAKKLLSSCFEDMISNALRVKFGKVGKE